MQKTLSSIQKQLQDLYSNAEIKSLSYLILEWVCKKDKSALLLDKDTHLSEIEYIQVQKIVEELKKYRPIQYILGESDFFGLKFFVDENVLIPRPETEELVDLILQKKIVSPKILDIGTGSGCIAISLAKNIPNAAVFALEISEKALTVSKKNAIRNNVNVTFILYDIFDDFPKTLPEKFDIIVSNPPYILPSEKMFMSSNVLDYEPHTALFVPENQPLLFYERIADIGLKHLKKDGFLFFETNALFGKATAEMLQNKGYSSVELFKDISGNDRMIRADLI
jgi:release factor glutamine methyltransferase